MDLIQVIAKVSSLRLTGRLFLNEIWKPPSGLCGVSCPDVRWEVRTGNAIPCPSQTPHPRGSGCLAQRVFCW